MKRMKSEIGREFMEKTKHRNLGPSDQTQGLPQPPLELDYDRTRALIDLPAPAELAVQAVDLQQAIQRRTSVRRYAPLSLSLEELSFLLWCTQGVKEVRRSVTFRTVPSAGARHAFETYLLVNRVEGITPGLYRFLALEHKLDETNLAPDVAERMTDACYRQKMVKTSGVTFVWVAVAYRMLWRYATRSYRYLHLDAGHVCQNLYLAAEAVDCGVCAIAAFDDDMMNQLLGLDGEEQFVIYLATAGKKIA
jgi:SagB-type dehydrogenase family enzyme